MELKVFSIRDSKAGIFNQPFYAQTHGEAERNFTRLARDEQSMVSQFPEDFDLYEVGVYNDQTGLIHCLETPKHMLKAVALKERQ